MLILNDEQENIHPFNNTHEFISSRYYFYSGLLY
jgi:hypothetical protein